MEKPDEYVDVDFYDINGVVLDGDAVMIMSFGETITRGEWEGGGTYRPEGPIKGGTPRNLNRYRRVTSSLFGDYFEVDVGNGVIAKCDIEALHLLQTYHWLFSGKLLRTLISIDGKATLLCFGQLVANLKEGESLRFRNGDPSDVRLRNIEVYTKIYQPHLDFVTPPAVVDNIVKEGELMGGHMVGSHQVKATCVSVVFTNPYLYKSFPFTGRKSKEAAIKESLEYQRAISLERGFLRNQYRHIWTSDGREYLQVMMQHNHMFICDLNQLELVQSCIWYWHNGYAYNGKKGRFHRNVLPGFEEVDHINGNRSDDRRCNLRDGTIINPRNHKIRVDNTSGESGVSYSTNVNAWAVDWSEAGSRHQRLFKCTKAGIDDTNAKELAVAFRRAINERLHLHVQRQ